jgi:hypothetical protein
MWSVYKCYRVFVCFRFVGIYLDDWGTFYSERVGEKIQRPLHLLKLLEGWLESIWNVKVCYLQSEPYSDQYSGGL